jgi:hypothetical protein
VVADQVQEGLVANELSRAVDGVTVSPRALLRNETHRASQVTGGLRVPGLIPWPHHDTNFSNIRGEGLLDEDAENGLFNSIVD